MKMINKMFVFALTAILISLTFTGFVSAITLPPIVTIGASPNPTTSSQSVITAIGIDLSGSGIDYVRIYENGAMVKECQTSVCVYVAVHITPGTRTYYATTEDNDGGTATSSNVDVDFQNIPPVLNPIGGQAVDNDTLLTFTISGYDYNSNPLTYSATGLPSGAAFNPATQVFSWTPSYAQVGTYYVTFSVSDGFDLDSEIVQIDVVGAVISDTILPLIDFVSPTETSGSTVSRDYILVNVTASDANLANITIELFNSTMDLINSTMSTTSLLYVNFTSLSDGIYYFNATAYDLAGNFNSTATRNVTIDTSSSTSTGDDDDDDDDGGSIKTVDTNQLTNGHYLYLDTDDKLKFVFCGSPFYIKLTDFDADDEKATFVLTPGNNGFVLREGDHEDIDLDSDDTDDILFRLESVSTSKVKVYIKKTSDSCDGVVSTSVDSTLMFEKLLPTEEGYNLGLAAVFLATGILLCTLGILFRYRKKFKRK